jgi:hypothetical protein
MQVYMAAIEERKSNLLETPDDFIEYALSSYFYLRDKKDVFELILKKCKHILIDSGAHSFQHGTKVDLDAFVDKYVEFIKKNTDNPRIEGFFEMDVDNVIGYEKVLEYRRKLEAVSDKIIPVWHGPRGVKEYYKMCKEYSGRRISIGAFKGYDIADSSYNYFINTAHKYNCKIHMLGITRMTLVKDLNLGKDDSIDSSSWLQSGIYGCVILPSKKCGKVVVESIKGLRTVHHTTITSLNYITGIWMSKLLMDVDQSVEVE